jgi:hypothetical protein
VTRPELEDAIAVARARSVEAVALRSGDFTDLARTVVLSARAGRWGVVERLARQGIEAMERRRLQAWDRNLARALVAAHALALEHVRPGPACGIVPVV